MKLLLEDIQHIVYVCNKQNHDKLLTLMYTLVVNPPEIAISSNHFKLNHDITIPFGLLSDRMLYFCKDVIKQMKMKRCKRDGQTITFTQYIDMHKLNADYLYFVSNVFIECLRYYSPNDVIYFLKSQSCPEYILSSVIAKSMAVSHD